MNVTTIEQSKKLVELGLKPETADMLYTFGRLDGVNVKLTEEHWKQMIDADIIPAWSLSALLELMPKFITEENEKYLLKIIPTDNNQIEMCYWNKFSGGLISDYIRKDSFMESAYNMTIWLLENEYIKK